MQTLRGSPDPALPRSGRHREKDNKKYKGNPKKNNHINIHINILLVQKLICKHKGLIPDSNVKAC